MVDILEKVLDRPELSGISRDFAGDFLDEYLAENPDALEKYERDPDRFERSKEFKRLRSTVRERLRNVYGVFFTEQYGPKADKLISELSAQPTRENAIAVLDIHRSSRERLPYYPFLYHQLFKVTGQPGSVLDLGCGFNPFAYPFMPGEPAYHSADIACTDLERIGRFFEAQGIEHTEHCIDLSDADAVSRLPPVDVALALKLFDSLEDLERNVTAELLEAIPARWLVASFPTASIGQRKRLPDREWFLRLVTGRVVSTVTLPNEQLFIITLQEHEGVTVGGQ